MYKQRQCLLGADQNVESGSIEQFELSDVAGKNFSNEEWGILHSVFVCRFCSFATSVERIPQLDWFTHGGIPFGKSRAAMVY
jgi:hypothetical protein